MPTPSRARYRSPDPLLLGSEDDDVSHIVKARPSLSKPTRTPTKTTSSSSNKISSGNKGSTPRRVIVELPSARKRPYDPASEPEVDEGEYVPLFPAKRHRTPLVRHQRSSNAGTPPSPFCRPSLEKVHKPISTSTPVKSTQRTPASAPKPSPNLSSTLNVKPSPVSKVTPSPVAKVKPSPMSKGKPSPVSQVKSTPAPSPKIAHPAKRARSSPSASALKLAESSPSSVSAISRETFLANEALKRQREARNFVFKGDADAPKLTRSGRFVGQAQEFEEDEGDDADEIVERANDWRVPDDSVAEVEDGIRLFPSRDLRVEPPEAKEKSTRLVQLPEGARPHIINILATLHSTDSLRPDPPPFIDEDKNEALQGLLNLLKGTVERGEGNSALIFGARGVGKTRTVARALHLLPSSSKTSPIVVRLSGLAQTNDRLAIREMGRQIAEAEGHKAQELDDVTEDPTEEGEYAPTTLPSHLLALLTAPSSRSIIIIIDEFDLFTEHARQALLYCLLDVVQSVKTGPIESTGRGVAVIGLTSRVDTLLLLEKRVKSRFSHRMWRVASPLAPDGMGWKGLMRRTLIPWEGEGEGGSGTSASLTVKEGRDLREWRWDWQFAIETLLSQEKVGRYLDRLVGLSTDVRNLYRPFVKPMSNILRGRLDFLSVPDLASSILDQLELAGWGLQHSKLRGLPQPALGVLIIAKHLAFAGREEFGFAMVEEEYLRFARTKLVGSGKVRWPVGVLRTAFDHLVRLSLLIPVSNTTVKPHFAKVRSALAPHEIVGFFKSDSGGAGLGPELVSWGRLMGGHA